MTPYARQKRRKASAIIASPSFNEAIKGIRVKVGIPEEGFQTAEQGQTWYREHHGENTAEPLTSQPRYYWHFPKGLMTLIETTDLNRPSRAGFYPAVPLDHHAMELIHDFGLPEEVLPAVKDYTLCRYHYLPIGPSLQPIILQINEGEEGTKYVVMIAGIDEEITKTEWEALWKEHIRPLTTGKRSEPRRPSESISVRDLNLRVLPN